MYKIQKYKRLGFFKSLQLVLATKPMTKIYVYTVGFFLLNNDRGYRGFVSLHKYLTLIHATSLLSHL